MPMAISKAITLIHQASEVAHYSGVQMLNTVNTALSLP